MAAPLFPGADAARRIPLLGSALSTLLRVLRIGRIEPLINDVEAAGLRYTTEVNEASILRHAASQAGIEDLRAHVATLRAEVDDLKHTAIRTAEMNAWRASVSAGVEQSLAEIRGEWRASLARNGLAIERAAQALAGSPRTLAGAPPKLDAPQLAIDLADSLRSRAAATERAHWYYPRIAGLRTVIGGYPVLDVAAGRGEWLDVLGRGKIAAVGVELNPALAASARALGAAVTLGDPVGHLRDRDPDSLAAVTAFRLVERLPFDQITLLIDAAFRAIAPGGLLILETANPENLAVAGCAFWGDPGNRRPIPPGLLQFYVAAAGFDKIEVARFFPQEGGADAVTLDEPVAPSLSGPVDYAIIARKAAAD